ncbi:acyltransferase family protein [Streptomyces sp. SP18CS02]|uniref:acyltransferase family protein n=1 Tax=Streptomyces sp. SP18CS02 TaxID=3002531 RepID=UPI002E75B235|nr:acyltransferase [Streptomyces sp. SP18CS02]MEE1755190.1 acyltransferase [Streptomyces sp. SP18CS02]
MTQPLTSASIGTTTVPEQPRTVAERAPRLDSLTGLRWWAAFAVFAHHMSNLAPLPIHETLAFGTYGVTLFFVLSGFVLTWSARPGVTAPTFYWRRVARIYPSHVVALLLAVPVFYSFTPDPAEWWVKPVAAGVLLLSVVLLQGWSLDPAITFSGNPAAWTLTCEFFFYALHPALHRLFGRVKARGALVLTVLTFAAAFLYRLAAWRWPDSWLGDVPHPVVRLSEFVIGIGIARAMLAGWRVRLRPLWCYLGSAALIAWLLRSREHSFDSPVLRGVADLTRVTTAEWIIVACTAMIAAIAWSDVTGRRSLLRTRPLVRLGEWSFAFYLVHATFVYALRDVYGLQPVAWTNLRWYVPLLLVSLAAAAALHHAVERPLERRLRAWWEGRAERRSTGARRLP